MTEKGLESEEDIRKLVGGSSYAYCYQCGACVGDCPSARHSAEFSPRKIIMMTMLGLEDELLTPDSIIWDCTNCYNCYERCPQDIHPIEVIIALKNLATRRGAVPDAYQRMTKVIHDQAASTSMNPTMERRRKELDLPDLYPAPLPEIQRLLEEV